MGYKLKQINPLSGQRLKQEYKRAGFTQQSLAEETVKRFGPEAEIEPAYIGHICQGKKRLTEERAKHFGIILDVRPEYLLAIDDFRTPDKSWFNHETTKIIKDGEFFEQCLAFFGYEIVGNYNDYSPDDPEEIFAIHIKIKKPTGEIVDMDDSAIDAMQKEIFNFIQFKLQTM